MSVKRPGGFTLIELIIFIVIISVGLAGVLMVFNTVTRGSADPIRAKQALAVAEGMMDEILAHGFCDPDAVTNAAAIPVACNANIQELNRNAFDSVDDYDGYARNGIRDIASDAVILLPDYNIRVTVPRPAGDFAVIGDAVTPDNYRIVTVMVTDALTGQRYELTAYKFNND